MRDGAGYKYVVHSGIHDRSDSRRPLPDRLQAGDVWIAGVRRKLVKSAYKTLFL